MATKAKTNTVTTSVVVQFTLGETGSVLLAEVDDREEADGGLNGGKTSFLPGDPVYILRYKSSDVVIDAEKTSLGSLGGGGSEQIEKTEDITFAGENEASLHYPCTGAFNYQWLGASLGSVSLINETTVRIPKAPTGSYQVGVARVTYTTTAETFLLTHSPLGLPDYSIVVFFAGHSGV